MARAPKTGYYFEPITERLVVVVEGASFPSDDHWAFVGDTIGMSGDEARLEVAGRWLGVDPDELFVEFDTDFERAAEDDERRRLEEAEGVIARHPTEVPIDLNKLFEQAEQLKLAAQQLKMEKAMAQKLEEAAEKAERERVSVAERNGKPGELSATVSKGTKIVRVPKRRPKQRK